MLRNHVFNVPNMYNVCKAPFFLRTRAAPAPFFPRSHLEILSAEKNPSEIGCRPGFQYTHPPPLVCSQGCCCHQHPLVSATLLCLPPISIFAASRFECVVSRDMSVTKLHINVKSATWRMVDYCRGKLLQPCFLVGGFYRGFSPRARNCCAASNSAS